MNDESGSTACSCSDASRPMPAAWHNRIAIGCRKSNKKLSYRRGTARRYTLVGACHVSRWQLERFRKVPISKSDHQGHSRALSLVPFDRPHTISYKPSIATMSLSCTVHEILSLISQNIKRHVTLITFLLGIQYSCFSTSVHQSAHEI